MKERKLFYTYKCNTCNKEFVIDVISLLTFGPKCVFCGETTKLFLLEESNNEIPKNTNCILERSR